MLDTFALLAYLGGEPPGRRVLDLMREQAVLYLSLINYGEALYIAERRGGRRAAEEVVRFVDNLPIQVVTADRTLTFAAAHVKAQHALSYADAFAVALAQELGATVMTGDPEFKAVENLVSVEWLPG